MTVPTRFKIYICYCKMVHTSKTGWAIGMRFTAIERGLNLSNYVFERINWNLFFIVSFYLKIVVWNYSSHTNHFVFTVEKNLKITNKKKTMYVGNRTSNRQTLSQLVLKILILIWEFSTRW